MEYKYSDFLGLRPREKLKSFGVNSLNDTELLSLLLGTGTKEKSVNVIADEISKVLCSKSDISYKELVNIKGVGEVKAGRLLASFEFVKRRINRDMVKISSSDDVYKISHNLISKKQEHFITISLSASSTIIKKRVVFVGTLNKSLVHPREVFAYAIRDRAANIILVHNHPSGNNTPSGDDLIITQKLSEAGCLLGIPVLDHLIVSETGYYSFNKEGLI